MICVINKLKTQPLPLNSHGATRMKLSPDSWRVLDSRESPCSDVFETDYPRENDSFNQLVVDYPRENDSFNQLGALYPA